MSNIYILMVNYDGQENTIKCLESLMDIKQVGFEVHTVIVDNASEKKIEVDESKYLEINLKVIFNPINSGFSGGINIGIKEALENKADYILIQNNDTIVAPDFLVKLFDFAKENKEVGIISPKIYFAKGFEFHKDRYKPQEQGKVFWYAGGDMDWGNVIAKHRGVDEVDHGQYEVAIETDFATGCSMFVKSEVFDKVGFLDEDYFLYYEDNDFSQKVLKENYKIYYLPTSVIWHKNAGSTGGSGSSLQDYYITRNRLSFGMKYAPIRAKAALIREGLKNSISGRQGQKWGCVDYFLGRMGKSSHF